MPSGKADSPILIRPAARSDLAKLTLICLRSKAVWGYSADFIAASRPALMLRPEDLTRSEVAVADRRGHALGVSQVTVDGPLAVLDKIFVAPQALRGGIGTALFAHAAEAARRLGAREMRIDSDPGAAGFFLRMGAQEAGKVACDLVPGRFLPRFVLAL